jgi:phosphatidyl-myo-inositol alpha-mannosyltransferase
VRFNGNRLSMPIWSSRRQIERVLQLEQPDIMHVMVPYSPFMSQRVICIAKRQAALVGSFHILPVGWLASLGARLLGLYQWRSLKSFDFFSATSPNAAKFAKKSMRINARFIPNAVDVARFGNDAKPIRSRIVFLGRLVPRKGCRQLIEAFELLSQANTSAELIIAGDGPQRASLEQLVQTKQLSDKVKFLGFVSEEDKPRILGSASVACFPSLGGESFGVVLLEAMAAGSGVVIGGNNPGYQAVLGQRPELLFDAHNTEGFAKRLALFLNDNNKAKQIHAWQDGEIGRYDINVVGAEFEKVYRRIIADKPATKA